MLIEELISNEASVAIKTPLRDALNGRADCSVVNTFLAGIGDRFWSLAPDEQLLAAALLELLQLRPYSPSPLVLGLMATLVPAGGREGDESARRVVRGSRSR